MEPRLTILAVDDNATNLEIIQVLLRSSGHTVLTATGGEEALTVARDASPDLIFMDLSMPGNIDGLEATRRLKGQRETAHIVIVALTAMVTPDDQSTAYAAGCDFFLRKPYSRKQLLELIDTHCRPVDLGNEGDACPPSGDGALSECYKSLQDRGWTKPNTF